MKIGPGIDQTERLAVAMHVGQDKDVRIVRVMKAVDHVWLGPAPMARKGDELMRRQRLTREYNKTVFMQRIFDLPKRYVFQRLRQQVCTRDSGAQNRRDFFNR